MPPDPLAGYTPDWRERRAQDPADPLASYTPDWREREGPERPWWQRAARAVVGADEGESIREAMAGNRTEARASGGQLLRGLAESGYGTGVGLTQVLGMDDANGSLRRQREEMREYYGDPESGGQAANAVTGRLAGDIGQFALPGAGAARLGLLPKVAATGAAGFAARQAVNTAVSAPITIAQAGDAESSTTSFLADVTESPLLDRMASSVPGRIAGDVALDLIGSSVIEGAGRGIGMGLNAATRRFDMSGAGSFPGTHTAAETRFAPPEAPVLPPVIPTTPMASPVQVGRETGAGLAEHWRTHPPVPPAAAPAPVEQVATAELPSVPRAEPGTAEHFTAYDRAMRAAAEDFAPTMPPAAPPGLDEEAWREGWEDTVRRRAASPQRVPGESALDRVLHADEELRVRNGDPRSPPVDVEPPHPVAIQTMGEDEAWRNQVRLARMKADEELKRVRLDPSIPVGAEFPDAMNYLRATQDLGGARDFALRYPELMPDLQRISTMPLEHVRENPAAFGDIYERLPEFSYEREMLERTADIRRAHLQQMDDEQFASTMAASSSPEERAAIEGDQRAWRGDDEVGRDRGGFASREAVEQLAAAGAGGLLGAAVDARMGEGDSVLDGALIGAGLGTAAPRAAGMAEDVSRAARKARRAVLAPRPPKRPLTGFNRPLRPWEATGDRMAPVYHGSGAAAKDWKVAPLGAGVQVQEDPTTLLGVASRYAIHPKARVLDAARSPQAAHPDLVEAVALHARARKVRVNGGRPVDIDKVVGGDGPGDPIHLDWMVAVNAFADDGGYDVVRYGPHWVMAKNPRALVLQPAPPKLPTSAGAAPSERANWGLSSTRVVNENGEPVVVYHGTNAAFSDFDPKKIDGGDDGQALLFGPGYYYTEDPHVAGGYAKGDVGAGERPNVRPARLAITNPFDMDAPVPVADAVRMLKDAGATWEAMHVESAFSRELARGEDLYAVLSKAVGNAKANRTLQRAGYDGITHIGGGRVGDREHRVWIAFDRRQIRSAFGPPDKASEAGFVDASVMSAIAQAGAGAAAGGAADMAVGDDRSPLEGMAAGAWMGAMHGRFGRTTWARLSESADAVADLTWKRSPAAGRLFFTHHNLPTDYRAARLATRRAFNEADMVAAEVDQVTRDYAPAVQRLLSDVSDAGGGGAEAIARRLGESRGMAGRDADYAAAVVSEMHEMFEGLGREMVEAGLLREEILKKHGGYYMPRYYRAVGERATPEGLVARFAAGRGHKLDESALGRTMARSETVSPEMEARRINHFGFRATAGVLQERKLIAGARFLTAVRGMDSAVHPEYRRLTDELSAARAASASVRAAAEDGVEGLERTTRKTFAIPRAPRMEGLEPSPERVTLPARGRRPPRGFDSITDGPLPRPRRGEPLPGVAHRREGFDGRRAGGGLAEPLDQIEPTSFPREYADEAPRAEGYRDARAAVMPEDNTATLRAKLAAAEADAAGAGFVKLPDTDAYGPMRGLYVTREVAADLKGMKEKDLLGGSLIEYYDKWLRRWKVGKTVLNPATWARNTAGGQILSWMGGGPIPFGSTFRKAVRLTLAARLPRSMPADLAELYREARATGLFDSSSVKSDLQRPLFERGFVTNAPAEEALSGLGDITGAGRRGVRRGFDKLVKGYNDEDVASRLAHFIHKRQKGMSVQQAASEAKKWVPAYEEVADAVRLWSRVVPFFGYTAAALPLVAEAAVTRPMRFLAAGAATAALGEMLFGDDPVPDAILPADLRSGFGDAAMPTKIPLAKGGGRIGKLFGIDEGERAYLEATYLMPYGDIGENRSGTKSPLAGVPGVVDIMSNPLLSTLGELKYNRNNLSGRERFNAADTPRSMWGDAADAIYKQALPGLAPGIPDFVPGLGAIDGGWGAEKLWDAATGQQNRRGESRNVPATLADVFLGLKTREIDPQREFGYRQGDLDQVERALAMDLSYALRDRGASEAARQRARDEYRAGMERVAEQHRSLAAARQQMNRRQQ